MEGDYRSSTLNSVINKYLSRVSNDRLVIDGKKFLRSQVPHSLSSSIESLKSIEINNLSHPINNPYSIAKLTSLTEVQCWMRKIAIENYFQKFGSIALQASCGSGKTLAGIYAIKTLQCKTLIISTRNAVIDQWYTQLTSMYPDLKIQTSEAKTIQTDTDIWIFSPQFLNAKNRIGDGHLLPIKPSLIIYDEVHTMISTTSKSEKMEFANVLKYPFAKCLNRQWSELPFMLCLSATYPNQPSELQKITKIFGEVINTKSIITDIPISIYDLRDDVPLRNRGKLDEKYKPLDPYECIEYLVENLSFVDEKGKLIIESQKNKNLPTIKISKLLKGLIITQTIDSSVYAALYIHHHLNVNVLLLRSNGEKSWYFDKSRYKDFELKRDIELKDLSTHSIGVSISNYSDAIDDAEIIVSTIPRVKEGFSNERIVWGITTQFPYSESTRVQIAGRIRRNSQIPEVIKAKRIFIVNSSCVPNNAFCGGRYNKYATTTYEWGIENRLFRNENIQYISNHIESTIYEK